MTRHALHHDNRDPWIESLEDLASILNIAGSVKKHKINDPCTEPVMHVALRLHLGDQRLNDVRKVPCVLLPPESAMIGTIYDVKKGKRIVNTSSKNIDKRNTLDRGSITENSHSIYPGFGQQCGRLLLVAVFVDCIKILCSNKIS